MSPNCARGVAAGDRVVDELLLARPVQVPVVRRRHDGRRVAIRRRDLDGELEVVRRVRRVLEVGQGRRAPSARRPTSRRRTAPSAAETTHGEIDVAKFLAPNGTPSGTYSNFCTSRADQSLHRTKPKMRSSACSIVSARPAGWAACEEGAIASEKRAELRAGARRVARRNCAPNCAPPELRAHPPTKKPISSSKSRSRHAACSVPFVGSVLSSWSWPRGRTTGVPLTTTDDARPW